MDEYGIQTLSPFEKKAAAEKQTIKSLNAVVHTTEEYTALVEQIKEQGGYISHTTSLYKDGLSVQYMIPKQQAE